MKWRMSDLSLGPIRRFFEEMIWAYEEKPKWWKRIIFGLFRFGYLVLTGITKNKTAIRATALAYTTLLSIVPLIAVMMAVTKAFGGLAKLEAYIEPIILNHLATGSGQIVQKYLVEFTQNLNASTVGIIGVGFLIITVVGLLSTIEAAFNDIWGVKLERSWVRRLIAYWSLVTIGPIFLAISIASTASLGSIYFIQTMVVKSSLISIILKLAPYFMTWIFFTFLYVFIPNTKVQVSSALIGGVLAGTLWEFARVGYTQIMSQSVQYHAVYGSLGALPIFLIWLYLTWVIVLMGAEMTFAHQNLETYREERMTTHVSQEYKEFLALNLVAYIGSFYDMQKGAVTARQMTKDFKIPIRLINEVLYTLCESGILLEIGEEESYYCPGKPLEKITVQNILETLRKSGQAPHVVHQTHYEDYFKKMIFAMNETSFKLSGQKNFKDIISELPSSLKLVQTK